MEVVDTVLLIKHLASLLRSGEQIDEFHDTRHQTLEGCLLYATGE
jgi:hypothetical protein